MATARTLDQILTELRPTYDPQVQSLQERANLIPQQIETEEQGLNAKKDQAFGDILNGARRRGLGFAGIPLAEQATYLSTDYAPSLARLRQSGRDQQMSLQDAILGVNERRDTQAHQIYQQEQERALSERMAEAQRAFEREQAEANRRAQLAASRAAAAAASPTFSYGGGGGGGQAAPQARVVQKGSGFQFYGVNNQPITAAQYAKAMGKNLGDVLYAMGSAGDKTARQLYGQLQVVANNPKLYQQTLSKYQKSLPWILGGV